MADRKVKYEIDVEAKADTVRKATKATTEFHKTAKTTEGVLGRLARQQLLAAEGFHTIGLAAHEAHAHVGEFLEFVGAEAAVEVLKKIAEKLADVGKEAVLSAAKAERMNRVIDSAAGGHEKGEENRKWLEHFASGGKGYTGTEFSEEQSEGAYVDLKKVGMTDQRARLAMKAAADIAAVSKNKDEAFGTAVEAFAHLKSMGRISARQLMPLGLGVEDFKKLDRFKGASDKSIRSAMENGKIDETDLYTLIMSRAGEKEIGKRASDNADLLGTKLSKLAELPERFFKKLADTKAVGELSHALEGMLEKLDPEGPVGSRVFGALDKAFTGVADLVADIDFDSLGSGVTKLASEIDPAIRLFQELAHDAKVAYDAVAPVAGFLLDYSGAGLAGKLIADRMAKREGLVAPKATERMRGFDYETAKAQLRGKGAHPALEGPVWEPGELNSLTAGGFGSAVTEGLAAGVHAKGDTAVEAIGEVADRMVDTVKRKHKIHSPSEVFGDIAAFDVAGYVNEIRRSKGDVADATAMTFGAPRATDVIRGAGGAPAGGGGRVGGGDMNIGPVQVYVSGGADAAAGNAAADAFEKRLDAWAARWVSRVRAARGA